MIMQIANKSGQSAERGENGDESGSDLAVIREQTRECLELLRALVGLLINKPEREGPTLEDLIAALIAQQRDGLVLLRQIVASQEAILGRLPALPVDRAGAGANGHAAHNGEQRP